MHDNKIGNSWLYERNNALLCQNKQFMFTYLRNSHYQYIFLTWLLIFTPAGEGGVEVDPLEAAKMFSELSEQGHPFAQVKDKFVRI